MTKTNEPLVAALDKNLGIYHGDGTFYWFTVHVGETETEENDAGEEERFMNRELWSGVRGLNTVYSCLFVYGSEETAWRALLSLLEKWRSAAIAMGYAPVGVVVECQEEFNEWHAHCDFDFGGRQVRLEGRLHSVNRF